VGASQHVNRTPRGILAFGACRTLAVSFTVALIAAAAERGLPHVYLGHCVEGYRSLAGKARFRPNEILCPDGRWVPFVTAP